ncbi:hypothetical protein BN6_73490 [Saccharothrix espanaensis DSM 44229]|uniref:Uncharacterized protein n=1 Tax=Saccharothrix espanaensis (strain ATCC 51144 / DSM 44229 / JCM 9112 / NBRC 15066 / NRRL 15764) TaxID=1179773 RepID=K0K2W9_SACES|nr:hypothetical protein BN6_73490 [Saccharothrix espanaensis DSM 44229]
MLCSGLVVVGVAGEVGEWLTRSGSGRRRGGWDWLDGCDLWSTSGWGRAYCGYRLSLGLLRVHRGRRDRGGGGGDRWSDRQVSGTPGRTRLRVAGAARASGDRLDCT